MFTRTPLSILTGPVGVPQLSWTQFESALLIGIHAPSDPQYRLYSFDLFVNINGAGYVNQGLVTEPPNPDFTWGGAAYSGPTIYSNPPFVGPGDTKYANLAGYPTGGGTDLIRWTLTYYCNKITSPNSITVAGHSVVADYSGSGSVNFF